MGIKSFFRRIYYNSKSTEELREIAESRKESLDSTNTLIRIYDRMSRQEYDHSSQRPHHLFSRGFDPIYFNRARSLRVEKKRREGILSEIEGILTERERRAA